MPWKQIVAIIRDDTVDQLLRNLQENGIRGISMMPVTGFGEYANPFNGRGLVTSTRIELFVTDEQLDTVVAIIMQSCYTGLLGDGVVAVLPVSSFERIRSHPWVDADAVDE